MASPTTKIKSSAESFSPSGDLVWKEIPCLAVAWERDVEHSVEEKHIFHIIM